MIEININPIIFTVGGFSLRWYSLLVMAAVVVVLAWTWQATKKAGISSDAVTTLALWAIPGGIIGSRLVHVIDQLDFYLANPRAIIGGEGQAIYGAILGGALAAWLGAKVHKIPFPQLVDLVVPGAILGQAVGRLANIVNGDAYGAPTSLPWGFVYTHPNTYAPPGIATHPSPAYEILWDLLVFALLLRLRGKLQPSGSLFLAYLGLYSVGRFFLSYTRVNDPFLVSWLNQAQIISIVVLVVTVPLLILRTRWVKQEKAPPSQP